MSTSCYLHDHSSTGFALVFAGGNGCWDVLSAEPMLRSRIYRKVAFAPMTDLEVREQIPRYHPIYEGCDEELLDEVDQRCCKGVFRDWAAFTATAITTMKHLGRAQLDPQVAELSMDRGRSLMPPRGP